TGRINGMRLIGTILRRVPLLVLAAASSLAVCFAFSAPDAEAAMLTPCHGAGVQGRASSLQALAQSIWTTTTGFYDSTAGCSVDPVTPAVSSASRGGCLLDWHADGPPFDTTLPLCGSDAAPTIAQITTADRSVTTGGSGTSVLSIPVAQSAIAIVGNPP